ncbi:hypothetical protein SLEP1_g25881 [Rubroshorea leprosula]|uniref:DUF4219 domain-containing protein n=1 Tax=Rubroshorea leprosula TaxID=152421 RepID=A0AAV5JKJ8_9ROSI|nr:hypothetical protein SLEP1_g25881 [Rubroshorea leprosula]
MEIVTSPSLIIPEVLKKDNYERWSILMQHYLELQNLWEVVQSGKMPQGGNREVWIKKNALALYAIRISCGTEAFDQIKKIRSAKRAWDALAVMLKPPVVQVFTRDIYCLHQGTQTGEQETLRQFICDGDISSVKQFLRDIRDPRPPEMLEFALQVAITYGHKNMARYLYRDIQQDLLQEDRAFILLQECITKKMFDIALDLLHSFPELAFSCPSGSTPIILTLAQTPPPFLRLNELGFWGRWIYNL